MRIADMCGQDTGGQSFKLSRAISEYTEHESVSFCKGQDYLKFPLDKRANPEFLKDVDIIHAHNWWSSVSGWGPVNPNAKRIIHQHGRFPDEETFLNHVKADKVYNAKRFVSTINLLGYVDNDPDRWIPSPIRLSDFDIKKEPHEGIIVCHTPTNRRLKHTDLLIRVIKELQEEGLPVKLNLIEGKTNEEAIREKASADIVFDQLLLQYGNSGLEGMALGLPVVCGSNCRDDIIKIIGYEPYAYATEDTLKDVLRELITNKDKREYFGKLGRKYVEEWHDDRKVAQKMINIYKSI